MFKIIHQSTTAVWKTFGKFSGISGPGLKFYIPIMHKITPVSNRLHQDPFKVEVKTKDNVFANLHIDVQYQVKPEDTEKAFFSMSEPVKQMTSYIENDIRSFSSRKNLDALFESQDEICQTVSENLSKKMKEHGYTIVNTLVTGIEPAKEVKDAMNRINATLRLKEAAINEANAHYEKEVGQARADKERKKLQGEGISEQRKAILEGYETGLEKMAQKLGLSNKEVIAFVQGFQHLDVMESIGRSQNAKIIFMNNNTNDLGSQLIKAQLATQSVDSVHKKEEL
jgi:regulator of protease activity HflC (stomatin/prohibitin superfamily)